MPTGKRLQQVLFAARRRVPVISRDVHRSIPREAILPGIPDSESLPGAPGLAASAGERRAGKVGDAAPHGVAAIGRFGETEKLGTNAGSEAIGADHGIMLNAVLDRLRVAPARGGN